MASYPTSIKSFSTKTDGGTISASHVNDLQDEVAAIETDILTGPLTLSGGQIAFPAAQNASAGANTLDDYEEGSWTPVIGGSGGQSGQAYTTQVGRYVKIGKAVFFQCEVTLSTEGTITDDVQIQGLPFTSENTAGVVAAIAVIWASLATNWVCIVGRIPINTTVVALVGATVANNNLSALTAADVGDTSSFILSGMYRAAN